MTTEPVTKTRFSDTQSAHRKGAYTDPHVALMVFLNDNEVAFKSEIEFIRPKEGYAVMVDGHKEWRYKTYTADIVVVDPRFVPTIIEVEGKGSNSADNEKRDAYFKVAGYELIHVSNADAKHDPGKVFKQLRTKTGRTSEERLN
jgi:very-short-patch-repair endonuclease